MRLLVALLVAAVGVPRLSGDQPDNRLPAFLQEWRLRLPVPQRREVRRQRAFPPSVPFPCETKGWRSPGRPTSVHRLRPGDVDVVGAMGDSLVAGNGALEEFALGTLIEYRGVSWCAGGQGTWREFLTLPNILKEFNPRLQGYSTGRGEFLAPTSRMNVAFPVSADADAYSQAKLLVRRMRAQPHIDFHNDWKVVTVFFGANDLCSAQCYDRQRASASQHAWKLQRALDYLHQHLPRTLVNLIPAPDVSASLRLKRTFMCHVLHVLFCQCLHFGPDYDKSAAISKLVKAYQQAEEHLVLSGRYDTREDFTVVLQPFTKLYNRPSSPAELKREVLDISYVTHDCFHMSQKGHALAANMLWNNMLQPVGNKSERALNYIMEKFLCPTDERPYLFTARNSQEFLTTGRQKSTNEVASSMK